MPTADERIDPPLVDIYVADGKRTGDKINHREAEVIIEEIKHIVDTPALAKIGTSENWRSIGVVSLIGSKQAALISRLLLQELGEEAILRHRIACGDSATFQGNERDIMFLSMIADSGNKNAQTAEQFQQRFNVAMSRARDRLYLVRSVRGEDLKEVDLKAKVIRHFADPMSGNAKPTRDLEARCDSDFEREILRRLVARGYRVIPQVGAMGYSIDLVVEGSGNRRLAVECDGDKYHGPERWADDMNRQRILERVGWRFWRCWSSSFTVDPEGCMADLVDTLDRAGIEPIGAESEDGSYTEHRTVKRTESSIFSAPDEAGTGKPFAIQPGDRIVVRFLDDNKMLSFVFIQNRNDPDNGLVSVGSPIGHAVAGADVGEEIEFEAGGVTRRLLIVQADHDERALVA